MQESTPSYWPMFLGNERSLSASSKVMVSRSMVDKSDAVFGLGASFFLRGFLSSPVFLSGTSSGSGRTSVTYGP
jgi:hypothetical protein